jgi:nicotinate phosphoribosyltransferase
MPGGRSAIFTDLYELTMLQGYWSKGINNRLACFELFYRENPFNGGYVINAGLEYALNFLENLAFTDEDIEYLSKLSLFETEFLDYLKNFRFTGDVFAIQEGTTVFPIEPILRVVAPLGEAQLVESALLNIISFQSLIATKSARVCLEAGKDNVMEFGLRRAQGYDGALTASRSAYIGGCAGTSNVLAGKVFGIPVYGTQAHSWIMAFENELEAFRRFVEVYPANPILLVDTYDTLKSGLPNAIMVGRELLERGGNLFGLRIDSGDLAYLSIEARKLLDEAGLDKTIIVGSSDLDEYIIHDLKIQGAKIDSYGVGTKLVTADGNPALTAVYKMTAIQDGSGSWIMKQKVSDNITKSTLPGIKQVWRLYGKEREMLGDIVEIDGTLLNFSKGVTGRHPHFEHVKTVYSSVTEAEPLLAEVMKGGRISIKLPALKEIRERAGSQLELLHPTVRRLLNPHNYKVSLGPVLSEETLALLRSNRV